MKKYSLQVETLEIFDLKKDDFLLGRNHCHSLFIATFSRELITEHFTGKHLFPSTIICQPVRKAIQKLFRSASATPLDQAEA